MSQQGYCECKTEYYKYRIGTKFFWKDSSSEAGGGGGSPWDAATSAFNDFRQEWSDKINNPPYRLDDKRVPVDYECKVRSSGSGTGTNNWEKQKMDLIYNLKCTAEYFMKDEKGNSVGPGKEAVKPSNLETPDPTTGEELNYDNKPAKQLISECPEECTDTDGGDLVEEGLDGDPEIKKQDPERKESEPVKITFEVKIKPGSSGKDNSIKAEYELDPINCRPVGWSLSSIGEGAASKGLDPLEGKKDGPTVNIPFTLYEEKQKFFYTYQKGHFCF
jgi:hypothetical protein